MKKWPGATEGEQGATFGPPDRQTADLEADIQESQADVESPVEVPGRIDEISGQTIGARRLGKDDEPHVRPVLRTPGHFVHVCSNCGVLGGSGYNP